LNDGIKEMFREGILSLHATAMLKSLTAEQQELFYSQFSTLQKIDEYDVQGFLAAIHHDKLYKCIAGKECLTCKKRTYYSNEEFFPELRSPNDDTCLDHECYMGRWRKLLFDRIKSVKGEHPDHAEASLIVIGNSYIRQTLGKSVTLKDGVEYKIKSVDWTAITGEPEGKKALPCFMLEVHEGKLKALARYWNEPEKAQSLPKDSNFAPMVKLLDLPKEEAEQITAAFKAKCKQPWDISNKTYDINRKAREKVFGRILESKAKQEADSDKDIERYLAGWLKDGNNGKIAELFAGAADVKSLLKLSWPKLFTALYASSMSSWRLPDAWKVAAEKQDDIAEWAGLSMAELKEMYKEELLPLMPKPKPAGKKGKDKPAKGKKAKKEAGEESGVRTCRECGCTDDDCSGCIEKTGDPCCWVEEDLCSACAEAGEDPPF